MAALPTCLLASCRELARQLEVEASAGRLGRLVANVAAERVRVRLRDRQAQAGALSSRPRPLTLGEPLEEKGDELVGYARTMVDDDQVHDLGPACAHLDRRLAVPQSVRQEI